MGRHVIGTVKFTRCSLGPVEVRAGIDRIRDSGGCDFQIDSEPGLIIDGLVVDGNDGDGCIGPSLQSYGAVQGAGVRAGFEQVIGGVPIMGTGIGANPKSEEILRLRRRKSIAAVDYGVVVTLVNRTVSAAILSHRRTWRITVATVICGVEGQVISNIGVVVGAVANERVHITPGVITVVAAEAKAGEILVKVQPTAGTWSWKGAIEFGSGRLRHKWANHRALRASRERHLEVDESRATVWLLTDPHKGEGVVAVGSESI